MATFDFTSLSPEQILKNKQSPQLDWSDPPKALAVLRRLVEDHVKADKSDPAVTEDVFPAVSREYEKLLVYVFRPANAPSDARLPLVVLYFPGGFIMGHALTLAPIARMLVKQLNVVVAAPMYRLAPEHPHETIVQDAWDTFNWVVENQDCLHADGQKGFIVGGISSGSNLSVVVAHLAKDKAVQPPITGVWLSCGAVRIAPKDAHLLPRKYQERNWSRTQDECTQSITASAGMEEFKRTALNADHDSRTFAPMIWSTEDGLGHRGFPKTYSQIAGIDTARDEALIFDDMLKARGIETRLDIYPGLPHAFFINLPNLPQSKQWLQDTLKGFAWLLDGSK